ncbi:MAG: aminotransferase class IV [Chitinophagaceae bacterium]|nr:aminotransferase class IV [Chitinophagaceae bacterium]
MFHVYFNGKMIPAGKPVFMADNRGYRYGDGLFETMKAIRGKVILEKYHFERLFGGLDLLKFRVPSLFTAAKLRKEIAALCRKNKCTGIARVRLSVFRGNGGLYDVVKGLQYLIECWPAEPSVNEWNKNGLDIDIYPDAEKSCDKFCNLKSANYLPYVMAVQFAKEHKLNDCLILNTKGHIADATIANIFLLKHSLLITPALPEGCVAGVMRRYLVEKLSSSSNFEVREGVVRRNDLENFDEVFLTNAMYGIRWVKRFGDKKYVNTHTASIYREHIAPLYS